MQSQVDLDLVSKRLYVGGLASDVTADEIVERFKQFGKVTNVSLKKRVDDQGKNYKSFAHLDIEGDEGSIKKCFNAYQNAKWKGSVLQLQYAKESFLDKLAKEREKELQEEKELSSKKKSSTLKPDTPKSVSNIVELKGPAVPGTPIPGKNDWIVGKYGRVLPVLKLKKSYKIKMVKHDPSKFCHTAKIFKDDNQNAPSNTSCDELTWEINTPDNEITRKRKGHFPQTPQVAKKMKMVSPVLDKTPHMGDVSVKVGKSPLRGMDVSDRKQSEDLEIVRLGAEHTNKPNVVTNQSNRFDSDIDSDSGIGQDSGAERERGKDKMTKAVSEVPQPAAVKLHIKPGSSSQKASQLLNSSKETVSVRAQMNVSSDSNKKVPEFKGLRMLGLSIKDSKACEEKTDTMNTTLIQRQLDSSHSIEDETQEVRKVRSSKKLSNDTKETAVKTPIGKREQVKKSVNKSDAIHTESKIVCDSDNAKSVKSANRYSDSPHSIPAFGGLRMLPDIFKEMSQNELPQSVENITEKEPSQVKSTKLKDKRVSPTVGKGAKSKPLKIDDGTSSLDLMATSEFTGKDEDYDSSCSANTDEFLTRYREKRGLQDMTVTSFSNDLNVKVPENGRSKYSSRKSSSSSLMDQSLILSELTAGVSDFAENLFQSSHSVSEPNASDSYDSDLDSNDFELVAKKLAQKATVNSKGTPKHSSAESGQKKRKLTSKSSDSTFEVVPNQKDKDGTMKRGEGVHRTSIQSKLLEVANAQGWQSTPKNSVTEISKVQMSKSAKRSPTPDQSQLDRHSTKQATGNKKRLQALKERLKQKEQQKSLMQKALQNVDSSTAGSSKRVVFDSDESDNDDKTDHGCEGDSDDSDTTEKHLNKSAKKEEGKKLTLFEGSSEEDDQDSDYEKMFESKPHFEGKKGEELMKLEKKIGDSRFKLSAKFLESDNDGEEEDNHAKPVEEKDDVEKGLEAEKAASLRVLENIIGKTTLDRFSEKIKKNTKHMIDMNAVRFDPTKVSSQQNQSSQEERRALKDMKITLPWLSKKDSNEGRMKEEEKDEENEKVENIIHGEKKEKQSDEKIERKKMITQQMVAEQSVEEEASTSQRKSQKGKKSKVKVSKEESAVDANVGSSDVTSKSKVRLAASLVDLFKEKGESADQGKTEETETFSLLKQFDQNDGGKNESNESESEFSENDVEVHIQKTRTPLSGLLGTTGSAKRKDMNGNKADHSTNNELVPSENSTGESDSEEESAGSEKDQSSQLSHALKSEVSENESSSEGEEESMDEEVLEAHVDTEINFDEDLKNAGRVDIRYTKEQWLQRWEEIRPTLTKMYKRKHKEALKSKRTQNEMIRRKNFLKNSRKGQWGRRKR